MAASRTRTSIFLIAAWLLAAGALTQLKHSVDAEVPAAGATVTLAIQAPGGAALLDAPVAAPAGAATVLGVLLEAGRLHGFPVEVEAFPGLGLMVVAIFDHRNAGACGWVYAVDGRGGDRSAADYGLRDGQAVRWSWSCAAA